MLIAWLVRNFLYDVEELVHVCIGAITPSRPNQDGCSKFMGQAHQRSQIAFIRGSWACHSTESQFLQARNLWSRSQELTPLGCWVNPRTAPTGHCMPSSG